MAIASAHRTEQHAERGVAAHGVEVRFIFDQRDERRVEIERPLEPLEGQKALVRQAVVASEVVMQDRLAGRNGDGMFQGVDCLGQLPGALVTPT